MRRITLSLLSILAIVVSSCMKKEKPIDVSTEDLHHSIDEVVEVMIHDIFSPPVASRIFVYPNIAAYEIIALEDPNYQSMVGKVKDLKPIPEPENPEAIN